MPRHQVILMVLAGLTFLLLPGVARAADSFESRLYVLSARWDRVKDTGSTVDPDCAAFAADSFNDAVPYVVLELEVEVAENLVVTAVPLVPAGILLDPFIALYCDPFDPDAPMDNLVATDDDGAGAPDAGFDPGDGVGVEPGQRYFLVVTSYGSSEGVQFGTFRVDLGGTATFVADGCPEDVNRSGDVDLLDLMSLLSAWGPCPGCPEDLTGNDVVSFADLLELLSGWGPCP